MAPDDVKGKKRKAAPDSQPKPKKQKKVDATGAAPKKSTKATKAAVEPVDSLSSNVKPSRKHAEDFFSDDEAPAKADTKKEKKSKKSKAAAAVGDNKLDVANASVPDPGLLKKPKKANKNKGSAAEALLEPDVPKEKTKKSKKPKKSDHAKVDVAEVELSVTEDAPDTLDDKTSKKAKKSKKSKKQEEALVEVAEVVAEADAAEGEDELDDQTAALLAGFESDRDESDLEKEDDDFSEEALEALPKLSNKKRKALEQARKDAEPGTIFLGRIPHGFFEPQMKKYFAQFGTVTRLRLSRNKKTGASKHFAFVEFDNADVADIVAKTMNNYLMFGHILQCKTIPPEQVHPELFKGANQRFKVDPRNRKQGVAMARGAERAVWEKRVDKENKKRGSKSKALKNEFGYDFSAPAVKAVEDVPKKILAVEDGPTRQLLAEASPAEVMEILQITESKPDQLTVTETVKVKKSKKGAKSKSEAESEANGVADDEPAVTLKTKKKRKSDIVAEAQDEAKDDVDASAPKAKKTKKDVKPADEEVATKKKRKGESAAQDVVKPKKAKKSKA